MLSGALYLALILAIWFIEFNPTRILEVDGFFGITSSILSITVAILRIIYFLVSKPSNHACFDSFFLDCNPTTNSPNKKYPQKHHSNY
jgi:hypothetical protein